MTEASDALADEYMRIDALRPPCPTCGGDYYDTYVCPDCVDGRMTVADCMAIVRAVFDDTPSDMPLINAAFEAGVDVTLKYLRSVRA